MLVLVAWGAVSAVSSTFRSLLSTWTWQQCPMTAWISHWELVLWVCMISFEFRPTSRTLWSQAAVKRNFRYSISGLAYADLAKIALLLLNVVSVFACCVSGFHCISQDCQNCTGPSSLPPGLFVLSSAEPCLYVIAASVLSIAEQESFVSVIVLYSGKLHQPFCHIFSCDSCMCACVLQRSLFTGVKIFSAEHRLTFQCN